MENGNQTMERVGQEKQNISLKTCKTCKEELPLDKFYRQYNFPQYHLANCKFCYLQNKKEYYQRKKHEKVY